MNTSLVFQNTSLEIVDHNNQPWLRATQIGTALEYAHPESAIRKIFNRHSDEFTETMTAVVKLTTPSGIQETRIFSLRGAHLLGMFAKTKVAKIFRSWALDMLEEVSKKETPQKSLYLTPAQKSHIKSIIADKCKSSSEAYQAAYSKMNHHFSVAKYDEIPASRYQDVCKYLGVKPLEGEYIAADQPKLAAPVLTINYPIKAQAIKSSRYTFLDMFDCGWLINLPSLLHELDKAKGQTLSVKVDNVEGIKKELVSLMHMVESQRMRLEDIAGMAARA